MACMECGEDRAMCHCTLEASPEGSVVITGNGEPGDPYVISAPGAGAGTREHDRGAVYDPELDGAYQAMPVGYPHFDFYGPVDPRIIPGYQPATFDGWYRVVRDARITLVDTSRSENNSAVAGTLGVPIPLAARSNDLLVVSASKPISSPPPGFATVTSTFFYKVLIDADQPGGAFTWTVPALCGLYAELFTGVDPVGVQDAAPATGFATQALSVTLGPVVPAIPNTLLLSSVTVTGDPASTSLLVPPGMTAVNTAAPGSAVPRHRVATQLLTVGGSSGTRTWSHSPALPQDYSGGMLIALRPALTFTYHLWINGAWTAISGSPSDGTGSSAPAGYAVTVGDGVHSTFTVPHALGTTDCLVECVNLETGQTCYPVVQRRAVDQVYLDFGDTVPATASRRVLINPL